MVSANWMIAIGQVGRHVLESIPEALWLVYEWAKDWQIVLGGLAILIAAQIFAVGSVRAARIRAAASVRAAQIAAGLIPNQEPRFADANTPSINPPSFRPASTVSPEQDLPHKLDQLRSFIRSAMALNVSDVDGADATGNIYCERILRLHFEEKDLPANATAGTLELYKRLLLQLAALRRTAEKGQPQHEVSEVLFQLNARARELAGAIAMTSGGTRPARQPGQVRL